MEADAEAGQVIYIISRCWLSLNRQSDLKLSFPFTLLHASLKGDAPRSPPKASAHAASVMFSDTALLRVIDGCVHLNFRIAKRTAWRHGRVVAWCRTRWRQSSWNSVLWRGPKTQKQRNDIGVCVWAIFLLFWIYFLVLAVFLIIGQGTVPKTLFHQTAREQKTSPLFFCCWPGPASPCLKARASEGVEVSVLPTFFKLGMLRYHEAWGNRT